MSINVDLNELLQQIPVLLSWIVPGLLFMFTFQRLKYEERNQEKESISILKAVCISFFVRYLIILVLSWISGDWLLGLDRNVWIAICSCFTAILFGFLSGWVSSLSAIKKFSEKYLHLTIYSNPFYDLADKKNGCFIRVMLKRYKKHYIYGMYSNCYNRGNEDWIVVQYAVRIDGDYNIEQEQQYYELIKNTDNLKNTKLLINSKEIDSVEYVYVQNNVQLTEQ